MPAKTDTRRPLSPALSAARGSGRQAKSLADAPAHIAGSVQGRRRFPDVAGFRHTKRLHHAAQPGLFKTDHPALHSFLGAFHGLFVRIGSTGQQIDVAESIVPGEQGVGAIQQGLQLTTQRIEIHGAGKSDHLGLLHARQDVIHIVPKDAVLRFLTPETALAKTDLFVMQVYLFHGMTGFPRSLDKGIGQQIRIAHPARAGRNDEDFFPTHGSFSFWL